MTGPGPEQNPTSEGARSPAAARGWALPPGRFCCPPFLYPPPPVSVMGHRLQVSCLNERHPCGQGPGLLEPLGVDENMTSSTPCSSTYRDIRPYRDIRLGGGVGLKEKESHLTGKRRN